jgi:DNA-binding beta-propeller fold protein YncE
MRNTTLAVAVLSSLVIAGGVALAHDSVQHAFAPPDALAVIATVRTGDGEHTYESIADWCKMPPGREYVGSTHGGIVEDKDGNIYFTMDFNKDGGDGILVYKPDGTFVKAIGGEKLSGIHGLCINDENGEQFLYGAQTRNKRVVKAKLDGTEVWSIPFEKVNESGKYENAGQYNPTAVAVGPDGSVYIADGYGTSWLHKFDKDQKYVLSFGGRGNGPGQFATCHGLGLDKRGEKPLLLICDRENRRLQHFDLDGKFVAVVAENLRRPCSLSFHGDYVAVAELEARVVILDKNNKEIAHLGDNPEKGQWAKFDVAPADWKPGIFTAPHGVSFDRAGDVYVMDWNQSGRLSKFKKVGGESKQASAGSRVVAR